MTDPTSSSPVWRLELLGGLRARRLDRPEDAPLEKFRTQKTASLLALLALKRTRQGRESLCEQLWPESEPEKARNSLRVSLWALRDLLEPPGIERGAVLQVARDSVTLSPAVETDVTLFLAALKEAGAAATPAQQQQALEAALSSYGGPLLRGHSNEWMVGEDGRLEDAYLVAVGQLIAMIEQGGQPLQALAVARRAVAAAPLREEALHETLRLALQLGQREQLVREFEAWKKRAESRGVALSAATLALVQRASEAPTAAPPPPTIAAPAPIKAAAPPQPKARGRALPGQWTSFFGRDTEMAALREWLSDASTRLVTLSGPGGSGKTRLALELGRRIKAAPKIDGPGTEHSHFSLVSWVSLADLREAHLIPGAILNAIGQPRGNESLDTIVEALRQIIMDAPESRLLLIFDNFEHLCDEGGPLVRELLDEMPELVCLITSRRRLGYGGEREWPLQTLETPDSSADLNPDGALPASVRLFTDRARLARPDFHLTPDNRKDVFRLVARLEGLPLALELAAARVTLFSPGQILAELDRQIETHPHETAAPSAPASLDWTNHDRAAPPRHHSLRAALQWSQRQLSPPAARFWAGLSAFSGGWTLDAAAYVCNEPDAGSLMLSLRDVSLISLDKLDETPRGSQLDVLREYAAEGLSPIDREALAARHARYFLDWAESIAPHLEGPRGPRLMARFEAEHDNLRAALEWHLQHDVEGALRFGSALWWPWEVRGHLNEGLLVLTRTVEAAERAFPNLENEATQGSPDARRRLKFLALTLNGAGKLATVTSDLDAAEQHFEKAMGYFRLLDDEVGIGDCLFGMGYMQLRRFDLDRARQLCDQSIAIFRGMGEAGKHSGLCEALNNRALVGIYDGDFDLVRELNDEQLAVHRAAGEKRGVAVALENLGIAALCQTEYKAARVYFTEALTLYENIDEMRSAARVLWGLGHCARAHGEEAVAIDSFSRALRLARDTQTQWNLPYIIEAFAYLAADKKEYARAARFASAATLMRETNHEPLPALMILQEFDRVVTQLKQELGQEEFDSQWMLGRSMSRDAIIALALDEQD